MRAFMAAFGVGAIIGGAALLAFFVAGCVAEARASYMPRKRYTKAKAVPVKSPSPASQPPISPSTPGDVIKLGEGSWKMLVLPDNPGQGQDPIPAVRWYCAQDAGTSVTEPSVVMGGKEVPLRSLR